MSNENKPPKQPPVGTGKKIMIVIEEEKGGHGFNLFMSGDKERISAGGGIPPEEMTPAEFWSMRLMQICVNAVRAAGAVQSEQPGGGKDA